MSGVDFRHFWGKAKPAPGGAMAHPNAWHCLDVAAAFQELCRLLPEQAAALCRAFDGPAKDTLQALTAAVAFHDLGKYSWAFQAKAPAVFPHCLGEWTQPPSADHTAIGYGLAEEDAPIARVVDSIVGPSNSLVRSSILIPVFGHHGRPIDPETGLGLAATMLRGNGAERNSASRQAARDFADAITLIFNNPCAPPLQPERAIELSWRLAGLIAIADWIGSNQDYFPYTSADIEIDQYWTEFAQPRAHAAVARCGLAPTAPAQGCSVAIVGGPDFIPTDAQKWAATVPLDAGLFIIEDVMGSGKTEGAVILAHRLMKAGAAGGLYFALPTMATSNALYERIAAIVLRLFEAGARPSLVLSHSARNLNPQFIRSIDFAEQLTNREARDETASAACAAWLSDDRRKTFLADIGVGTVDQALLAVLPVKHSPVRQLGLAQHVLILDEVHAYDSYMQRELEALVEHQARMRAPVIVLSATLPSRIRDRLAAAYARGRGIAAPQMAGSDYPLATSVGTSLVETPLRVRDGLARDISVRRLNDEFEAERLIVNAARGGAAGAYIRNTVDDAIASAERLAKAGVDVELFHARFAMGDRLVIESRAVRRFGKDGTTDDRRGRVLIATQVAEQSLDLDFDVMVTDLAPIDLMLQRAGRLWRHRRESRGWPKAELCVVSPPLSEDADKAWYFRAFPKAGWVYRDHALLWSSASEIFVHDVISSPSDLRRLVEAVYAPKALERAPKALRWSGEKAAGQASADRGIASLNLLNLDAGYSPSSGLWGPDTVTPTRLGDERVLLRLARLDGGGRLVPWIDDDDPRRAWALSEVSVRAVRAASRGALPPELETQATALDAVWERNSVHALTAPLVQTDGNWLLSLKRIDGARAWATYDARFGLQWIARQ